MTAARRELVVRRGAIESIPAPDGGSFAKFSVLPVGLPRVVTGGMGIFCANTAERVISLTYDDGPHPENTPRILDVLADHGAKATFFVLGRQVERYPYITRRIIADGHQLALHGHDHTSLLTLTTAKALARLSDARRRVEDLVGQRIDLYRPPYGDYSARQARGIKRMGLDLVLWSGDALDWRLTEERAIVDRALEVVFPGAILLFHDNRADADSTSRSADTGVDRARVAHSVLRALADQQYRAISVGDLIHAHQRVKSVIRRVRST
jgi:peptidoglycan/xylan/chitin deacetylase (PgdA/CDA1 family)